MIEGSVDSDPGSGRRPRVAGLRPGIDKAGPERSRLPLGPTLPRLPTMPRTTTNDRVGGRPASAKPLVIVESPAKARTISAMLGPGFVVESSVGHIRDLPRRAGEVPAAYRGKVGLASESTSTTGSSPSM